MIDFLRRWFARLLGRDCWLCGEPAKARDEVCAECEELDLNWRRYRGENPSF